MATPFSSSSTILIVESSSSTPSTSRPPDAPDCGSRSREMYSCHGSRQGFLIFCMIFFIKRAPKRSFVYIG